MPHPSPLISIVTVNYNSIADTLELIGSIQKSDYDNWELWVVDNASEENPNAQVEGLHPKVHFIRSEENLGFAGGNNLALPHVNGAYVFFVNNDAVMPENCLSDLVKTLPKLKKLGALSPKFHYYHNKGTIEFAGSTRVNSISARNGALYNRKKDDGVSGIIETDYVHGAGMLVPMDVIKNVGPMHEGFFLYYEELDWCERIRRAGYKIYCQRDALLYHKVSASVGKLNPMKTFYLNRNRILFMNRNYPFPRNLPFFIFLIFISIPVNIIRYLIGGDFKHLNAYLKAIFWHVNPKITY